MVQRMRLWLQCIQRTRFLVLPTKPICINQLVQCMHLLVHIGYIGQLMSLLVYLVQLVHRMRLLVHLVQQVQFHLRPFGAVHELVGPPLHIVQLVKRFSYLMQLVDLVKRMRMIVGPPRPPCPAGLASPALVLTGPHRLGWASACACSFSSSSASVSRPAHAHRRTHLLLCV